MCPPSFHRMGRGIKGEGIVRVLLQKLRRHFEFELLLWLVRISFESDLIFTDLERVGPDQHRFS